MDGTTLYIFLDESGDFNFSSTGTKYFILSSISTLGPIDGRHELTQIKYQLLQDGHDLEYFHATENKQYIRDCVFSIIDQLGDIEVDSVIAEKRKANFTLYKDPGPDSKKYSKNRTHQVEEKLYKQICETLLQYTIRRYIQFKSKIKIQKIVVIQDRLFTERKREFITKHIKTYIHSNFGIMPHVYFHQMKSDPNCQIVDYCCWAIAVKWERNEQRSYLQIKSKIKSEFEIFSSGTTYFY